MLFSRKSIKFGGIKMGKVIAFRYPKSLIRNIDLLSIRGGTHYLFLLPFEIKGMGITSFPDRENAGWFKCRVTIRAFDKLKNQYSLLQQAYESDDCSDNLDEWCKEIDDYLNL